MPQLHDSHNWHDVIPANQAAVMYIKSLCFYSLLLSTNPVGEFINMPACDKYVSASYNLQTWIWSKGFRVYLKWLKRGVTPNLWSVYTYHSEYCSWVDYSSQAAIAK